MLSLEWESEGLQTVGIVVIICASLKLLHLLGLIDFSEGKVVAFQFWAIVVRATFLLGDRQTLQEVEWV